VKLRGELLQLGLRIIVICEMLNVMTRKSIAASLILLLSITACDQGPVKVVVGDKATDEVAIRHLLDEVANTFNAGNYDGMFALYRDDVIVSSPGQPDIVGKEAWKAGLAALPAGVTLKMRFDTKELEIDGEMAYERGTYLIEAKDAASGEFAPLMEGRHIHIFRREADGWKGWRLMENSADPRTSPLSLPPATK
jgi:ketosteroid isomerase-like protein